MRGKRVLVAFALAALGIVFGSSDAHAWGRHGCFGRAAGCYGVSGGCYGSASACYGCSGCYGGSSCYGCAGCYGGSGCYGCAGDSGCYGGSSCYGCSGCYGCEGCNGCGGCNARCHGGAARRCTPRRRSRHATECACSGSCFGCSGCYGTSCYGSGCYGSSGCYSGCYTATSAGSYGGIVASTAPARVASSSVAGSAPDKTSQKTQLTLQVPADAKVSLQGVETPAAGSQRIFRTSRLATGQVWPNYLVRVVVERGGQQVVQEKRIDMHGGEAYELKFDFSDSLVASR